MQFFYMQFSYMQFSYMQFFYMQFFFRKDHNGIIKLKQISTSSCVVILDDKGESKLHVGDMKAHDYISCEHVINYQQIYSSFEE